MNVEIFDLPKEIYDECVKIKLESFVLKFSSDDDGCSERHLEIDLNLERDSILFSYDYNDRCCILAKMEGTILLWASDNYKYECTGTYQHATNIDNITYNIKENKTVIESWKMIQQLEKMAQSDLKVKE